MPPDAILDMAEMTIGRASRERPADAVLRAAFAKDRRFTPDQRRWISERVFCYYRWLGWLDSNRPLVEQLADALETDELFRTAPASFSDGDLLSRAIPGWVLAEMDVTPGMPRVLQQRPVLWLRARPGTGKQLGAKLGNCSPAAPGGGDSLEYSGPQDLFRTPEFHGGEFELQDLSSQAVGLICAPEPGQTWWDVCAGEGGKALHLGDLMGRKGLIWATDRQEWRLQKLKRRFSRAGLFNYRARVWDGAGALPTGTKFDGVLVDAPCSGVGTWRRHPQARWTTIPGDVRELAEVQKRLLARVAPTVKPGGRLIYSVCTLTRAETVEVTAWVEENLPDLERCEVKNSAGGARGAREGEVWFRPEDSGGNGMFVAVWRRKRGMPGAPV